jgi:iron complex outermembrane recepter protein
MAYAKAGTGYRVGGFNTVVTVPNQPKPVPESYDNEDSTTYEFGLKSAGLSYSLSAAAYISKVDGALITDTNGCSLANACGQNPTSFTANGGDASVWGIELEGSKIIPVGSGQLRLKLSASRQEGEFTSGIYDDFEMPQTPDWIAASDLRLTMPVGANSEFTAGLSYHAQWGGLQDVTLPLFELADREITDVRIGFNHGRWQTTLTVSNVFDEEYYVLRQPTLRRWNNDRRSSSIQMRYVW